MTANRLASLTAHNIRLLRTDPGPIIAMSIMPILMIIFLRGMGRTALEADGYDGVSGAEHIVPGMAVLFSLFGVVYLGIAFYQEHGWGTWNRLRMSPASTSEILIAKLVPSAAVVFTQTALLFGVGWMFFDLSISGSRVALFLMMFSSTAMLISIAMVAVAVFRSINQLSAATNAGALLLGGLGGAIAPVETLPSWAQAIAPLSPAHWSMQGYRTVVLDGGSVADIGGPVAVLAAVSVAAAVVSAKRFRLAEPKDWT